jgi:PAS domain S-box-containing protein
MSDTFSTGEKRPAESPKPSTFLPSRRYLLIGLFALLLIGDVGYGFYLGYHIPAEHIPWINGTTGIKLETTSSHLWLQEILSGDHPEKSMDEVWKGQAAADEYARAMLEGGKSLGWTFIPIKDPELRQEIQELRLKLASFSKIIRQRVVAGKQAGIGTDIDRKYDAIFKDLVGQTDRVEATLTKTIKQELRLFRNIEITLVLACLILAFSVGVTFNRFGRKQAADLLVIRKSRDEIIKQNQYLNSIISSLTHPFYIINAEDYTISLSNPATQIAPGSEGATCYTLTHHKSQPCNGKHPCPLRKVKETKKPVMVEHLHHDKDGNPRLVEIHGYPILDHDGEVAQMIEYVLDISERRQMEDALRDSEAALKSIFKAAPVGIGMVTNRVFTFLNDAMCRMIGYSREELLGKSSRILYPTDEEFERVGREKYAEIKERGVGAIETRFEQKNGRVFDVWLSSSSIDPSDLSKGVTFTALDISERKRAEKELAKHRERLEELIKNRTADLEDAQKALVILLEDMNLSKEELEETNLALEEQARELTAVNKELETFSYSVSHDLRAPLRSLDGFSRALQENYEEKLDEEGKDYLQRVRATSQRMGQLIDDLLKLSRLTGGRIHREPVDLSALARKIVAGLQEAEPQRRAEFVIAEDAVTEGDARLIEIVLENLLDNAWKFTGKRDLAKIEFGQTKIGGLSAYFVRDNGVGFDMAYAGRLFGAFQRLHSTAEFPGTGIGLATVQRIINRHGGRIWAEAEVDGGATFYFIL